MQVVVCISSVNKQAGITEWILSLQGLPRQIFWLEH